MLTLLHHHWSFMQTNMISNKPSHMELESLKSILKCGLPALCKLHFPDRRLLWVALHSLFAGVVYVLTVPICIQQTVSSGAHVPFSIVFRWLFATAEIFSNYLTFTHRLN